MSADYRATGGHEAMPAPWRRLGSEAGPDLHIFRVRIDHLENPRTGRQLPRVVLEAPDWVNVIALTPDREVILVRQYRFGVGAVTTEIPGGIVDPGETSEVAARRELLEETGYSAEKWTYLGSVEPNPAFLNNLCHHWLAEGARQVQLPRLDGGEDIRAATLTLPELQQAIAAGEIRHALVLTAVCRILDLRAVTTQPAG
jgi:ADP-ribose pyrophosphatase